MEITEPEVHPSVSRTEQEPEIHSLDSRTGQELELPHSVSKTGRGGNRYTKFTCYYCNYVTFHKGHFTDHVDTHTKKQFCCKICKRKFTRKRDALRHIKVQHKVLDIAENLELYLLMERLKK